MYSSIDCINFIVGNRFEVFCVAVEQVVIFMVSQNVCANAPFSFSTNKTLYEINFDPTKLRKQLLLERYIVMMVRQRKSFEKNGKTYQVAILGLGG